METESQNAKYGKSGQEEHPELVPEQNGLGGNTSTTDLERHSHPDTVQDCNAQPEALPSDITAEYLKSNTQIHGWLSFLLFMLVTHGITSVLISFLPDNQDYVESDMYYENFYWFIGDVLSALILCALSFYTLYSFCKRRPNAVFLAKTYLIACFAINIVLSVAVDYGNSGIGSLSNIIGSLIGNAIWFLYLCFSPQVRTVIPPSYRKQTRLDYGIIAALIATPLMFIALGIGEAQDNLYRSEQEFMENAALNLNDDEYTDGAIIFTCPAGFICEQYYDEAEWPRWIWSELANSDSTTTITIFSDYNTDESLDEFTDYWEGWQDEELELYDSEVVIYEKRHANQCPYHYKVVRYDLDTSLYWRFVRLLAPASGKACTISAYDCGDDDYLNELLQSIRFE